MSADHPSSDAVPFDADPGLDPPRTRSWKVVLWLLVAVMALCLIGGGGAYWVITRGAKAVQDGPRRATTAFLGDLQTGGYNDAYLSLCDLTTKQFTREQFVAQMQTEPKIASYDIRDVSVRTVDNVDTAVVTVDIVRVGGTVDHHSILLTSQDGTWLICGQPF